MNSFSLFAALFSLVLLTTSVLSAPLSYSSWTTTTFPDLSGFSSPSATYSTSSSTTVNFNNALNGAGSGGSPSTASTTYPPPSPPPPTSPIPSLPPLATVTHSMMLILVSMCWLVGLLPSRCPQLGRGLGVSSWDVLLLVKRLAPGLLGIMSARLHHNKYISTTHKKQRKY